jgi:hypothetical protein
MPGAGSGALEEYAEAQVSAAEHVLTSVDLGSRVLSYLDARSLLRTAVTISLRTIVMHNPLWECLMRHKFPGTERDVGPSVGATNWRFEYEWKSTSIRRYQRSLMSCQGRLPQKPRAPVPFDWSSDSAAEMLRSRPIPVTNIAEKNSVAEKQSATKNTSLRQGSACWSALARTPS